MAVQHCPLVYIYFLLALGIQKNPEKIATLQILLSMGFDYREDENKGKSLSLKKDDDLNLGGWKK